MFVNAMLTFVLTAYTVCSLECTCEYGYFQLHPCSDHHNVSCHACRRCEVGEQYRIGVCTPKSSSDFACANCTVCGDKQYEAQSCNETHDTVCKDCSVCSEGLTYAVGACGPESDSDLTCLECSRCGEGQYVSQPCNLTHDTVCSELFSLITSERAPVTPTTIIYIETTKEFFKYSPISNSTRVAVSIQPLSSASISNHAFETAHPQSNSSILASRINSSFGLEPNVTSCLTCNTFVKLAASDYMNGSFVAEQTQANIAEFTSVGKLPKTNLTSRTNNTCRMCAYGKYTAVPCSLQLPAVCAACSACAAGFIEVAACSNTSDTVCAAVPPSPTIRAADGAATHSGFARVAVSVAPSSPALAFVNFSVSGSPPPTCVAGGARQPNATLLLQATATVTAVTCAFITDSLVAASDVAAVTFIVQPAPSVVVSLSITSDLPAAAFTPAMLGPLGDAMAAALGLPSWQVEVIGVRDVSRRRLLGALAVDFRILSATPAAAAALEQQVAAANLTAVATASGLPLAISSVTAQVVTPPPPPALPGSTNITLVGDIAALAFGNLTGSSSSAQVWVTSAPPRANTSLPEPSLAATSIHSTQPIHTPPDGGTTAAVNTTPAVGQIQPQPPLADGSSTAIIAGAVSASVAAALAAAIALWVGCHRRRADARLATAKAADGRLACNADYVIAASAAERGEYAEERAATSEEPPTPAAGTAELVFHSPHLEILREAVGDFRVWG